MTIAVILIVVDNNMNEFIKISTSRREGKILSWKSAVTHSKFLNFIFGGLPVVIYYKS